MFYEKNDRGTCICIHKPFGRLPLIFTCNVLLMIFRLWAPFLLVQNLSVAYELNTILSSLFNTMAKLYYKMAFCLKERHSLLLFWRTCW